MTKADSSMPPKRGEGAAKLADLGPKTLTEFLLEIRKRIRQNSESEMLEDGEPFANICDDLEMAAIWAKESSPSALIAAVEADRKETADELRAAGAYPFNPAWLVSNKKRYEKVVENIDSIADRLALGKPANLLRSPPTEEVA